MKRLFLTTVSILALAKVAGAADLPVKAAPAPVPVIPTWAGFYVGIQGGVAAHSASFTELDGLIGTAIGAKYHGDRTGGLVGINAGYNFQSGNLVYGLEGDWNWVGAKASSSFANSGGVTTATSFDVRWLATVRGRLGLAAGPALFYATGGIAFADIDNTAVFLNPGGALRGIFSDNKTKAGWAAGGGIEYMFGPHWTARIEGRYVDLGKDTVTCGATCNGVVTYRGEFRNTLAIGLVALDYKF
jgi:outer membrane immunogenic protein